MKASFCVPLLASLLWLAACTEAPTAAAPGPMTLNAEAAGYYCQMNLLEHEGPKAQIHLAGHEHPVWFTQIRDAVAFTRLREETAEVVAIYVNDMGRAPSWKQPGADNWIAADKAVFVIESRINGGMGAPEAVPFSNQESAGLFVQKNGGRIVRFAEIPDDYVLAPINVSAALKAGAGDGK